MKCTPELMKLIANSIESIDYGSIEIGLAEKGEFIEVIVKEKIRISKLQVKIPVE